MKLQIVNRLDIIIESINYVIISYALSNMAVLFQDNLLFILFFASEIWVMNNFWQKVNKLSKSKVVSSILLVACFAINVGLIYFMGRIVGNIIPFKQ